MTHWQEIRFPHDGSSEHSFVDASDDRDRRRILEAFEAWITSRGASQLPSVSWQDFAVFPRDQVEEIRSELDRRHMMREHRLRRTKADDLVFVGAWLSKEWHEETSAILGRPLGIWYVDIYKLAKPGYVLGVTKRDSGYPNPVRWQGASVLATPQELLLAIRKVAEPARVPAMLAFRHAQAVDGALASLGGERV